MRGAFNVAIGGACWRDPLAPLTFPPYHCSRVEPDFIAGQYARARTGPLVAGGTPARCRSGPADDSRVRRGSVGRPHRLREIADDGVPVDRLRSGDVLHGDLPARRP